MFWIISIGVLLVVGAWAYWPRRRRGPDDELVRHQKRVDRGFVEQYRPPNPPNPPGPGINF
jgi:hypothetical protein